MRGNVRLFSLPTLIGKREQIGNTKYGRGIDTIQHTAFVTGGNVKTTSGYNHYVSNGKHGGYTTTHAEKHALDNFTSQTRTRNNKKRKAILVVIRTNLANSRPCANCIRFIANHPTIHIKRVYYSINGGLMYESLQSLISSDVCHVSKGNRTSCCEDISDDDSDEPNKRINF